MIPRVIGARYLHGYVIRLRFSDGTEGDVDLKDELYGEIFHPLLDLGYFKRFTVHSELHTLTWPNGADFAPEFLFEKMKVTA